MAEEPLTDPLTSDQPASTTESIETPTLTIKEIKEKYFELLRGWMNHEYFAHAMALAQYQHYYSTVARDPRLIQPTPLQFGLPVPPGTSPLNFPNAVGVQQPHQPVPLPLPQNQFQRFAVNIFNRNRMRREDIFDNQARNEEIINQNGGYEFVIAPLWKRFIAETIDVGLLFILKLVIAFLIIDIFELDFGFDFESFRSTIEEDYTEFISFSSEMIYIEILTKIMVCIYEAAWTRHGPGPQMGGATPGKVLMGLRILYVEAVVPIVQPAAVNFNQIHQMPLRALIFPAQSLGFKRAFCRALAKNLLMALLFPLCFIMLFFRNNRTSYDIMTKTIVVEENLAPVLRRP